MHSLEECVDVSVTVTSSRSFSRAPCECGAAMHISEGLLREVTGERGLLDILVVLEGCNELREELELQVVVSVRCIHGRKGRRG